MKYIIKITLGLVLCAGFVTSCKDDDEPGIDGITVDKEEITIGAEGGTEKIAVSSNTQWVTRASEPWIAISPANGIGSAVCDLAIDSTLMNTARTAQIRFSADGRESKLVTVTQFGFGKLDEGVMNTHPDLAGNIWVNEGEELYADTDADGNGYKDDKYGYNFVSNTGIISWTEASDTGHGTHVAGTIVAMNGNGIGVCGIAGGDGSENSGVKLMSCQVFSGDAGVTLDAEARAIKYAADNGAVILQCSWGYNSSLASIIEGYTPGPGSEEEWESLYPLEKEALDYFINNAGSPNGVIDGGLVIFASGNEYAGMPAFPGAYSKCVSVSAVAADFTPASYTDYGKEVTISAPGGDTEYYNPVGKDDPESWIDGIYSGSILSTWIQNGTAAYGFMDGTSMACPHVSGVAALGLSYAVKQRRHFKASEFIELLKASTKSLDSWYGNGKVKTYYRNHLSAGASPTRVELSKYIGKMGAGLVDAGMLLNNIEGSGSDMVVPNIYVAESATSTLDLAYYFVNGETLTYTCTSSDPAIATVTVSGTLMKVSGVKTGAARIVVKVSNGSEQTITVTVRKKANDNGWM